jgi:flagellar protein FlbT
VRRFALATAPEVRKSRVRIRKMALIGLHNSNAFRLFYEALTILGKDRDHIGQKASARANRHLFEPAEENNGPQRRQRRTGMALKVELKPHERIIIGSCVITNTDQRARLLIDGDKIPILREKDILTPATADTPAKLVYLAVQLMYISPDPQDNHGTYFNLLRDILTTAPSMWSIIEGINTNILSGDLYQALKEARKLVAYEKKLLDQNAARRQQEAGAQARRSA